MSGTAINDNAKGAVIHPTDYLYGTPGAENMEFDPESVLEHETNDLVTIEEWAVKPPRSHLPEADVLLDWLAESDYEVTEGWWESATDACDDELKAAAEALLDLMASKITFRMADRHIANLTYRWDGDEDTGEYVLVAREITAEGERLASLSQNSRSPGGGTDGVG